jgi:hypothetical protein
MFAAVVVEEQLFVKVNARGRAAQETLARLLFVVEPQALECSPLSQLSVSALHRAGQRILYVLHPRLD